jgi:hypothetical protein
VIKWVGVLGACVATAGLVHLLRDRPVTDTDTGSPLQVRKRAMLQAAQNEPGDAALELLSRELNVRHFAGALPSVKVNWRSDLDRLDLGDYRLIGMTDGKVILLDAALQNDEANARRTLCHEMVHVKFMAAGDRSANHDVAFQSELRRISEDGCFEAILATPEEMEALKAWVDSERERLDAARLQVSARGDAVKAAADASQRTFADLNERIRIATAAGSPAPSTDEISAAERRQADANQSILDYNAALAANQRDQAQFNEAVRRYNLMQAYPDGLAEDRAKGPVR